MRTFKVYSQQLSDTQHSVIEYGHCAVPHIPTTLITEHLYLLTHFAHTSPLTPCLLRLSGCSLYL